MRSKPVSCKQLADAKGDAAVALIIALGPPFLRLLLIAAERRGTINSGSNLSQEKRFDALLDAWFFGLRPALWALLDDVKKRQPLDADMTRLAGHAVQTTLFGTGAPAQGSE